MGIMDLQRAKDMVEFRSAMLKFRGFASSFLFAAYLGDVGFWAAGQVPKRQSIKQSLYIREARNSYGCDGFMETNLNPHIMNPEKGFIVTCSNKISQSGLFLGLGSTIPGNVRAAKAHEILHNKVITKQMISMEDVKKMQRNMHNKYASTLLPAMLNVVKNELGSLSSKDITHYNEIKRLISILEEWNHEMDGDSKGALIYNVWIEKLFELLLKNSFSTEEIDVIKSLAPTESFVGKFVDNLYKRGESVDKDICSTNNIRTSCAELLVTGLAKTHEYILANIGKSEKYWRWDYINTQDYYHPVYSNSWLNFLFHKKTRSGV